MDKFEGEAILRFLHGSENGISPGCDGSSALFDYKTLIFRRFASSVWE